MLSKLLGLFTSTEPQPSRGPRIPPTFSEASLATAAPRGAQDTASAAGSSASAPGPENSASVSDLPASIPLQEVAIKATTHKGPVYKHMPVPAYPTHGAAVPAATPEMLIETQMPLIRRIHQASTLSREEFYGYILPVIRNYAAFVHLLPASETHHHCQVGGLFRHSLEVAYYAAVKCTSQVFALTQTPMFRKEQEPRWRACAVLAGLLHDIGKAMLDLGAKDETGRLMWEANTHSLYDWLVESKLDYYFIYWRPGLRGQRHEAFATVKVDKMIPQATNLWLNDFGGRAAVIAMYAALNGDTNPTNQIVKIITRADSMSVEKDIEEAAAREAGIGEGGRRGISARITRTIHDLLDSGEWLLNEPNHPIWVTTEGVFGIFPTIAERIADALRSKNDKSVPTDPVAIIDFLDQSGQLASNVQPGGEFICTWDARIFPAEKTERADYPILRYVRFTRDKTLIPHRIVRPKPAYAVIYDAAGKPIAGAPPPWLHDKAVPMPAVERKEHVDAKRVDETIPAQAEDEIVLDTPLRDRHTESSPRQEKLFEARTAMASKWPPVTAEETTQWLEKEGADGEILLAIANRIHSQRLKLGVDVIQHGGFVHIRFPDGLEELGVSPRDVVVQMEKKGWLVRDTATSARATVTIPGARGKSVTAVRLNENVSQAFALLLPQAIAELPPPPSSDRSAPAAAPSEGEGKPLGPYIDANVAARLRSLDRFDPADTPHLRLAYSAYLTDVRHRGQLSDNTSTKDLRALMREFVKLHKGVITTILFDHLTTEPNEIYSLNSQQETLPSRSRDLSINITYNPDLDLAASGVSS